MTATPIPVGLLHPCWSDRTPKQLRRAVRRTHTPPLPPDDPRRVMVREWQRRLRLAERMLRLVNYIAEHDGADPELVAARFRWSTRGNCLNVLNMNGTATDALADGMHQYTHAEMEYLAVALADDLWEMEDNARWAERIGRPLSELVAHLTQLLAGLDDGTPCHRSRRATESPPPTCKRRTPLATAHASTAPPRWSCRLVLTGAHPRVRPSPGAPPT